MSADFNPGITPTFSCDICKFKSANIKDYKRHLLTAKHQKNDKVDTLETMETKNGEKNEKTKKTKKIMK